MIIISILISTIVISALVSYYLRQIVKIKQRELLYRFYANIMEIYNSSKELAYQKIFRENVLAYASSGYKIEPDMINKIQSEYVTIVLTYCGPSIKQDLITLHGSFDSIVALLASELMVKIENDEATIINIKQQGTPPIGLPSNGE